MTPDQITGILRAVFAAIGGFILNKGWVSAETWQWFVGGALMVGPIVWSWLKNRPASIAANAKGIQGVNVTTDRTATPEVANAVAAAKG